MFQIDFRDQHPRVVRAPLAGRSCTVFLPKTASDVMPRSRTYVARLDRADFLTEWQFDRAFRAPMTSSAINARRPYLKFMLPGYRGADRNEHAYEVQYWQDGNVVRRYVLCSGSEMATIAWELVSLETVLRYVPRSALDTNRDISIIRRTAVPSTSAWIGRGAPPWLPESPPQVVAPRAVQRTPPAATPTVYVTAAPTPPETPAENAEVTEINDPNISDAAARARLIEID